MDDKRQVICEEGPNLHRPDKIAILRIVRRYEEEYVTECADGSRVNIDLLPPEAIDEIYGLIRRRLDTRDIN